MPLLGHAVMVLAALLLLSAGWRIASAIDRSGLERAAEAITIAAAAAILEALALGQFSLGSNRWALLFAASVTAGLARWRFPTPEITLTDDLRNWWRGSTVFVRVVVGGALGALLGTVTSALVAPQIGFDAMFYHYPEVIQWVHSGRPGSNITVNYDLPVEAYPHNGEMLMTWGAGIARSFIPLVLVGTLSFPLLVAGVVLVMRALSVRAVVTAAAVVALVAQPMVAAQTTIYTGDVPALAWAVIASGLALMADRNPRRLAIALIAGGLALGTKTTVLTPLAIVLLGSLWVNRGSLAANLRWLLPGAVIGATVSGVWLVRTTLEHGWPFWPFQSAPWGDPVPPAMSKVADGRFIDAAWATLTHDPILLGSVLGGTTLLLLGGLLSPLIRPTRQVAAAVGLLLVSLLTWSFVPGTGQPNEFFFQTISELRYFCGTTVIATAAIALTAAATGWRSRLAVPLFAASTVVSALAIFGIPGSSWVSGEGGNASAGTVNAYPLWFTATAVAGGFVAWLATFAAGHPPGDGARDGMAPASGDGQKKGKSRGAIAIALVTLSVIAISMAMAADGFTIRWTGSARPYDLGAHQVGEGNQDTVTKAFLRQPAWRDGNEPVSFGSRVLVASLAGDRLQHNLLLLPATASCAALRRSADRGWVVTAPSGYWGGAFGYRRYNAYDCFNREIPAWTGEFNVYRFDLPWRK